MPAFKARPNMVTAVQWTGKNRAEVLFLARETIGPTPDDSVIAFSDTAPMVRMKFQDGILTAFPGDWIVRGVQGEISFINPQLFDLMYEPLTD